MKLTIVEKNLLSWTAMHIDFVMCKKGDSLDFLNIHSVGKYQKIDGGTLWSNKKMRNLKSHSAEKRGKSHSVEKRGKGTLLLWYGFYLMLEALDALKMKY